MTISITTPAYRAEAYIGRAVRSMLVQTHQEWEMIIISDDGQDYQSILNAQGIEDGRLRFTTTNAIGAGPSRARNIGIDCARYNIISNLDADDRYPKTFLEEVLPAVRQHGAISTSYCLLDEVTGKDIPQYWVLKEDTILTIEHILRYGFAYANIIFDRNRSSAKWPEGMHFSEDLFFWFLLMDDISAIVYQAAPCYHYYYRHGSLSHPSDNDTRTFCERRAKMIRALEMEVPPIRNRENRNFFKNWLQASNDVEEIFNYQYVDSDLFQAEFRKRFDALTASGN